MADKLRIGQIGIAHTHATKAVAQASRPVLEKLEVEFVGIYEPDAAMWEGRHGREDYAGVRWCDTAEEILGDPTIAAVLIETWPWECQDWARRALEAGKHIHLDKPPGTSLPVLRELYELAGEKGLCIQMGYQWRFNPGLQLAQKIVRDGLLGRVNFARFRAGSTPEYYHRNHVHRYPGGIMQEEACHLFDQVVYMFGRADRISPFLRSDARGYDGFPDGVDNALVVLEFDEQGAMAVIETTSLETEPGPHRRVEIHGLNGSIVLEPIEPPRIDLCLRQARGGYAAGWQEVAVEDRPRYIGDLEEWIGVIRGEHAPYFSPEHDLLTQETLIRGCGGEL